ncbi:molybdopterin converting factor subunit 1 [Pontibacter sp. E15-1]|uniref:molybdopterin converting factor subunit 1 n=1 Tax=Pontibacter sp. E15-1 TaxID=2919918 RepID=UPI001F503E69|nr:molybdopterin converting factor subunit 1 [Pontibacter sp. E15-1]MCJ8165053.1 molybdopterin converting factor subunit 1 [Pontibacter sp. E15-1]
MKVNVLAFGIAKDIFGKPAVAVEVEENTTVATLKSALEAQFPRLKQLSSFMIAVNSEYAQADNVLQARDEIAIIPPVSGG